MKELKTTEIINMILKYFVYIYRSDNQELSTF